MITILSVLSKNENNESNQNESNQNNNLINQNNNQEYPPCSRCKSKDHFNLECMYKSISK